MTVPELGVPDYVRLSRHEFDLSDDGHEVVELGVTNETDTTLRLAPDGAGGVEFAASASAITIQDEGTPLATAATTLNFVGSGVTATGAGATKTLTIPGAGALDDLTDVTITSAAAGQRLRYDGSGWVNVFTRHEPTVDSTGSVLVDGAGNPLMIEVHT